jgi:capsular exopolysaccharide synthesis family protein
MEFDLRAYARTLLKRKWYAAGVLVLFMLGGVFITARAPKIYETQMTLLVGERQVTIEQAQEGLFVRNLSFALMKTYAEIFTSRSIIQQALVDSGVNLPPAFVAAGMTAKAVPDTQILEVTHRDIDPTRVARVANAVADAFVEHIEQIESAGTPAVEVSVLDRAQAPSRPVSPNPTRNLALAFLLGLLAAGGAAFLIDHLDVSVKQREEVEALGYPVLGAIPRLDFKGESVHLERDLQGPGGEAFRMIRTAIGFVNLESPVRTLLVTSAMAQEGKTTTSLNLAAAYAVGGLRTLLVEADLRRPSLHRLFGMYGTRGLTTAIVGDVSLSDAILNTDMRNLSVLMAGAIPPNPVELLGSDQMSDVLDRLQRSFDIVIVDSPPLIPVADPSALAGRCDGVVIVARAGKTDRRRLVQGVQVVQRAGGRLIGVVLNDVRFDGSPGSYEYYYGYPGDGARAAAGKEMR